MKIKFYSILSLIVIVLSIISCNSDSITPEVDLMVGESETGATGILINEAFPFKKVRVEGNGLAKLQSIILDNKIDVAFNPVYNSNNSFIFDVPFDKEGLGSRFGLQPIKFITEYATIEKEINIIQPKPTIVKVIKSGDLVDVEGLWYFDISSVTYNGEPIQYEVISDKLIKISIPLNNFIPGDLVITSPGGSTTRFIDDSLFFESELVTDFDGNGKRTLSWFSYGDIGSFTDVSIGGSNGKFATLIWSGQNSFGYNGTSTDGTEPYFDSSEKNNPEDAYIDIECSGTLDGHVSIQLNTIDGVNFGYNFKLTTTEWKRYSLRLSDFKNNYGYGSTVLGNPNPSKVAEIKVGVVQSDTPNSTTINFDNITIKYKL